MVTGTRDDAYVNQTLHPLVDSSTGNATLGGHVFKRYTRVARDDFEYFLVETINFFHNPIRYFTVLLAKVGKKFQSAIPFTKKMTPKETFGVIL